MFRRSCIQAIIVTASCMLFTLTISCTPQSPVLPASPTSAPTTPVPPTPTLEPTPTSTSTLTATPSPAPTRTLTPLPPRGELIAFASMDNDGWGIYLAKEDGRGLTRLQGELDMFTEVPSSAFNLTWSPNGQMIAFLADYEGNQDIFVADLSTGSFQRIGGTENDDWFPTWSPDGQWIVFASKDRIMRIHPDGSGMDTLINAVDEITGTGALSQVAHPSWSPEGRYLVVTASGFGIGQFDIFVRDFASSSDQATPLIKNQNANDFYPTFAPSGFKLAFISAASMDSKYDLFFTDPQQGNPVKITDHKAQFPFSFAWSPDGSQIAYSVQIGDRSEIFVVEPVGTGPIQITGEPLSGETIGFSEDGSRYPSWSPDSSRIAFQTNRDGNWEIYVMNADGSGQTNITNSSSMDISPAWQP